MITHTANCWYLICAVGRLFHTRNCKCLDFWEYSPTLLNFQLPTRQLNNDSNVYFLPAGCTRRIRRYFRYAGDNFEFFSSRLFHAKFNPIGAGVKCGTSKIDFSEFRNKNAQDISLVRFFFYKIFSICGEFHEWFY